MHFYYQALFTIVASICLSLCVFPLHLKAECIYISPRYPCGTFLFEEIKAKSDLAEETFASLAAFFQSLRVFSHQFHFRYPLESPEQAKLFSKLLQIKAQEAHRFVPAISECHFIEPRHLGFSRRITIKDGPIVQEHVLVEPLSDSVMFIEEFAVMPDGEIQTGAFTAMNSVVEENGSCVFTGIYLYSTAPTEKQIQEREVMFRMTYENMLEFLQEGRVDQMYEALKQ